MSLGHDLSLSRSLTIYSPSSASKAKAIAGGIAECAGGISFAAAESPKF
jgi:hypothetical protein